MRGEYAPVWVSVTVWGELPPHARRIRGRRTRTGQRFGTTSACAENTEKAKNRAVAAANYLRMRGEYPK